MSSIVVDPDELDAAEQFLSLIGNLPLAIEQPWAYDPSDNFA
jgi:hypothetical protein